MTFVVHNILFVARVTSLALEWSEGTNDDMRDTSKLYAREKSCDYHYQYTKPNCTKSFNKKKKCLTEM